MRREIVGRGGSNGRKVAEGVGVAGGEEVGRRRRSLEEPKERIDEGDEGRNFFIG